MILYDILLSMSKESVDRIRQAIEEAQKSKDIRERQRAIEKQAEADRREAERQALIVQNEARLRATGVVDLFEALRDSGLLKLSEERQIETTTTHRSFWKEWEESTVKIIDAEPAVIGWSSDKRGISIEFDSYLTYAEDSEGFDCCFGHTLSLEAKIMEDGRLKIGKHETEQGEKLEDVVVNEILRLKGI